MINIIRSVGDTDNDLENYIVKLTALLGTKRPQFASVLRKIIESNCVHEHSISSSDIRDYLPNKATASEQATALNQFKNVGIKTGIFSSTSATGVMLNQSLFSSNGIGFNSFIINYENSIKTISNSDLNSDYSVSTSFTSDDYLNDLLNLIRIGKPARDKSLSKVIQMFDDKGRINITYGHGSFGKMCEEIGLKNNRALRDKIELLVSHNIFKRDKNHLQLSSSLILSKKWFNDLESNQHSLLVEFKNKKITIKTLQ
ncbi:conserved hypothetical protein [Vibrio crassostreae]|uniref:hypothetical protein n=1 Tax=Vibrio TaxID=662 RepID=UPI000C817CBF|nr:MULTISPECIES: hypothetical protein [Vibrio]PMH83433.1 hypothetical protein BCU58_14785 [Vibrio sp. 10N.286.48.B7]TCT63789.1 hypothetical protein EDB40_101281 [Vibrio crassostreae]CAK2019957.1 conserved hypothetical protein [Vibrio crassostreae]CAK2070233.1 conserved hypothetical protein [Vibrio crassostreae]CAK2091881.1 conserved hypothetical protein [Vibrio crassostreae]